MRSVICDFCSGVGTTKCNMCEWANPCLGCKYYDIVASQCKSSGGCVREEGVENERFNKPESGDKCG